MKSGLVAICFVAACVAACDRRPEPPAKPATPALRTVERPGPVRWNPATSAFEAGGKPLRTFRLWTFDGSTEGFTALHSQVSPAEPQGLAVTLADPTLRSPRGLQIMGAEFPLVIVRLTRTGAGEAWDGALYYSTTMHGEGSGWLGLPMDNTPPKLGETVTLIYDMSRQPRGAPDWTESVIDQIRLDIEDRPGGRFVIQQVAVAALPVGVTLASGAGAAAEAQAPPELAMEPTPDATRQLLAAAQPARACNLEAATLGAAAEGMTLRLSGWISELADANTSPVGRVRLVGPGGDFVGDIPVDEPRPDVARHFKAGPAVAASGFSEGYRLPKLAAGTYTPWVYRRTPGGWISCKGVQTLDAS